MLTKDVLTPGMRAWEQQRPGLALAYTMGAVRSITEMCTDQLIGYQAAIEMIAAHFDALTEVTTEQTAAEIDPRADRGSW